MKPSEVHKTIGKHILVDGDSMVLDLEKSHGVYIVDALTGKEWIDFFTFFAANPLSFNHPKMKTPEFLERLTAASITKPSNSDFYTTYMAEFVNAFSRVAMPKSMPHLYVVSGGTMAVENALKVAFDWKVRKNFAAISKASGKGTILIDGLGSKIIHFQDAFHGRSGYSLSMTNTEDPRKYIYFPKFDWPRIVNPRLRFPITEEVIAEVHKLEEIAYAQIETAVRQYKGDIAGLIIEPIQGEGGDHHFRPEFFKELRRLADEHEFLLIYDEVQSGMGITGKMWAWEHFDVEPDVLSFGKKSQVCGIIAGKRIDEVEKNVFKESSRINSTFGGTLTDMVRVTRILEIIEEDKLVEHTAKMGEKMITGLENVAEESKGMISNVRGKGLMIAYDLPSKEKREEMLKTLAENGLKALPCGHLSIRFRGMLDTPEEIIDKALELVAKSIPVK
ncbi:MAG: L-lysine 6-transaminase [Anaerolineales bacterium]|jgi:L-lysine 6-transaminase